MDVSSRTPDSYRLRLLCGHGIGGDRSEVGRFQLEGQGAGIGEREGAEVLDQALELTVSARIR